MNAEQFSEALGEIDERYLTEAEAYRPKKTPWIKWTALAACFALAVFLGAKFLARPAVKPEEPTGDGPPFVIVEGRRYTVSPYFEYREELPEGFAENGTVYSPDWQADLPLAQNPEDPLLIYLWQKIQNGDPPKEPTFAWFPYVDPALRGRDLLSYNGVLYISMWSAQYWDGSSKDVSETFYRESRSRFGDIRINRLPDSFVSVGTPDFIGHNLVPTGVLSANVELGEVFSDPNYSDAVLVSTHWYTHTKEEQRETRHDGYDVYIRYDGPLNH